MRLSASGRSTPEILAKSGMTRLENDRAMRLRRTLAYLQALQEAHVELVVGSFHVASKICRVLSHLRLKTMVIGA
jgi:hypothetical protein